jgi:hypothetical protein
MLCNIISLIRVPVPLLVAALLAIAPARGHEKQAEVTIARADCARLVEHVPAADVAYQPGVDAYGREVMSADLNGGTQIPVPETLHIPIEIDLLDRFGIPAHPDLYESDIPLGEVVYQNGRLSFNGQPLQNEAAAELSRRCQRIMTGASE